MIRIHLWLLVSSFLQLHLAQAQITINEDFADGNITTSPIWYGNTNSFSILNTSTIAGCATNGSFIGSNTLQGKVCLVTESTITDEWSISLATTDFSPSGMNYIGVILMSDVAISGDISTNTWNGYYLRIGDDATDKVCLYKHVGKLSTLIGEFNTPSFTSNGLKNGLSLNIKRSANNFILRYKLDFLNELSLYTDAGSLYDDSFKTSSYFGIFQVINNASINRRLFADNISLSNYFNNYVWNGNINGDFSNSLNWTPTKEFSFSTDKLVFNSSTAIAVTNIKSMQLNSLTLVNNSVVRLKAANAIPATIDIKNIVEIDKHSKLIFDIEGAIDNPIILNLNKGAKATIYGSIEFTDTYDHGLPAHRLIAEDEHTIIFYTGASFIANDLDDSPFGNNGLNNTVEFMDGSTYYAFDGAAPFGKTQPDTKVVFNSNSNYIHCSNLPPSLAGRTYGNLTIDYAGSMYYNNGSNASTGCTINNLYLKKGTVIIQLSSNKQKQNIQLKGNLTIDTGATFKYIPTTSQAYSILTFNGTTEQYISGKGTIELGKNTTLEIANSNHVQLEKDVYTQGNLSFSNNAKLILNKNNISVDSLINNASATQFIVTNSNYNENCGYVIRKIKQGSNQYLFPVGTSLTDYTPCTIADNTGAEGHIALKVFDHLYEHGKYGNQLPEKKVITKTWEINTTDALDVTIKLQWNQENEGNFFNRSTAKMSKNKGITNDDSWRIITTTKSGADGSGPYTLEATNVSSFSKFGIASDDATLPIELLSFTGSYLNNSTILKWITASESNNEKFIIERSPDEISFETIGIVGGAGNSNTTTTYTFMDNSISDKINYYRLNQVDYDGKLKYFPMIAVDCSNKTAETLYQLYDVYGHLVYEGNREPETNGYLQVPKGIYLLKSCEDKVCKSTKIWLK